ncbi:VanZ family protein [Actinopolyspora sp. H202]|uniref:VanZ family protein n=1 Tax=Actinopolyspora sp. H202 TaxID=1500456 RepID=UPI003EE60A08
MLEAVIRSVVSPASVAVFVVLTLLGAVLHGRLVRAAGTRRIPTLAAMTALAAGTAVTLTPQSGPEFGLSARRVFACPLGWPASPGLLDLPVPTQSSLNSLVLLPFGVCAGLAVRNRLHTAAVVAVILLLPALVEASQGFTLFVRHCSAQDWLDNVSGGLLGVALVLLVRAITGAFSDKRHRDGASTEQHR